MPDQPPRRPNFRKLTALSTLGLDKDDEL